LKLKDLAKKIDSKQSPCVVDVRSGGEYRAGHIPGALHAPLLKTMLRLVRLPPDREALLVVTCEHGPRAQLAQALLKKMGYGNTVLLDGQMTGWRRAGLPLEK